MMQTRLFALCLAAVNSRAMIQGVPEPNYIVNGGFEQGLTGWKTSGHVQLNTTSPMAGKQSVRIGPGLGSVSQRYDVPGLRIITFGATVHTSDPGVEGAVRVRCFDRRGHVVMELNQAIDPKKSAEAKGAGTGIYFKTQAFTDHLVVSIEQTSAGPGFLDADAVELKDDDHNRVPHAPLGNLDQQMMPIWLGKTTYDESVLLVSKNGAGPSGKLLFKPSIILSVRDSALHQTFEQGRDYEIHGQEIVALPGSRMTTMKDSDFPKGDYPWLSVAGKHVFVTYSHEETWQGPTAKFAPENLPKSIALLEGKRPLTMVVLGDSITLGINVSAFRNEPPYMPTWPELAARELKKRYQDPHLTLYNVALGGMTAQWGADNAKSAVADLNPDLVLIAFGMNDFWSVGPDAFLKSIEATMATIREHRPNVEFVLVTSIRFDPAYTADPTYVGHMTGYAKGLRSLAGRGVAILDMTEMSEALYAAKSAKDLLADPMHPDDFLARWYAQSFVALLSRP